MLRRVRSLRDWLVLSPAEAAERLLGCRVTTARQLSGGDLSSVFHLTLEGGGALIIKQAPAAGAEAEMLRAIAASGAPAPEVLAADGEWLLMKEIAHDGGVGSAWDNLADLLARLHAVEAPHYGWSADHAFGPVRIENGWCADWPAFWADRRLRCHLPFLRPELGRRIEQVADRIDALLPRRPRPALLHGDLWGGNILVQGSRVAALIDPACYHGDREVDAAMLTLFDRPPRSFFAALKLEPGWRERQPLYRLWPLLVHLRLFGESYAGSVVGALAAAGF
jgi:fructosamine-3-kinase